MGWDWENHNTSCIWILRTAPAYGSKSTVVVAPTGRMERLGSTVLQISILLPLSSVLTVLPLPTTTALRAALSPCFARVCLSQLVIYKKKRSTSSLLHIYVEQNCRKIEERQIIASNYISNYCWCHFNVFVS